MGCGFSLGGLSLLLVPDGFEWVKGILGWWWLWRVGPLEVLVG